MFFWRGGWCIIACFGMWISPVFLGVHKKKICDFVDSVGGCDSLKTSKRCQLFTLQTRGRWDLVVSCQSTVTASWLIKQGSAVPLWSQHTAHSFSHFTHSSEGC